MCLQICRPATGQGVVFEAKISEHLGGQDVVGQQTQCIARGSNRGHGDGVEVEVDRLGVGSVICAWSVLSVGVSTQHCCGGRCCRNLENLRCRSENCWHSAGTHLKIFPIINRVNSGKTSS